jgi:gluconokinase
MARAVIVMGVSGSGKTTVGRALAQRLGWSFRDADDHHPSSNVEKMRAGIALDDRDRAPWLDRLNALLRHSTAKRVPVVLACSALKQAYRDALAERAGGLIFVHLAGSIELIGGRLANRAHRYMPASLLRSQFDTLEAPRDALVVDAALPVDEIVERIIAQSGLTACGPQATGTHGKS